MEVRGEQPDDVLHVLLVQLMKDNDVVYPVDELRFEAALHLFHDPGLHALIVPLRVADGGEAQVLGIHDPLGPCVGGHDQHGVLEAHLPALGIRDMAVVQNLQQDVEHVRVGLLDLVEEHHGIGVAPDLLGELPALVKAHVARRGAYHLGHGMPLHILGHVHADDRLLGAEHGLRQGLGQLCLAHAGGAQEQEGADGALGILQAYAASAHGPGHGHHRLLLADDPPVEDALQLQ